VHGLWDLSHWLSGCSLSARYKTGYDEPTNKLAARSGGTVAQRDFCYRQSRHVPGKFDFYICHRALEAQPRTRARQQQPRWRACGR
jgi:hypothetical protein